MRLPRALCFIMAACLTFSSAAASQKIDPVRAAGMAPEDVLIATDQYGYQMYSASSLPAFIEVAPPAGAGSEVSFIDGDDSLSGLVNIGFSFPFYETSYSALYVDTNGLAYFNFQNQSKPAFQPLPLNVSPNNLLALLWTDLDLDPQDTVHYPSGKVYSYFHNETGTANDYFVLEWKNVYLFDTNTSITLEMVLYPNGNILFRYQPLPTDLIAAVIGIEDANGEDGLMYWDGSAPWGTPGDRAIYFLRPGASKRVKVSPKMQGGFTMGDATSFAFTLTNNGNTGLGSTQYTLKPIPSDLTWQVTLLNGSGTPLPDANLDGKFETGSLNEGTAFPFKVKLSAPKPLQEGDYIELKLRAATLDESKVMTVTLQSAVPAAFAQTSIRPETGIHLNNYWKMNSIGGTISSIYPGTNISMDRTAGAKYAVAWVKGCVSGGCPSSKWANTDVQMSLFAQPYPYVLNNHAISESGRWTVNPKIWSQVHEPTVAPALNGRIGFAWYQELVNIDNSLANANIYFNLADAGGNLMLTHPISVTNDSTWNLIPPYLSPRIAASVNNKFLVFWVERYQQASQYYDRLYYSILGSDGQATSTTRQLLADSQTSNSQFQEINVEKVNGNQVIVALSVSSITSLRGSKPHGIELPDPGSVVKKPASGLASYPNGTSSIAYMVVDDDGGAPVKNYTVLAASGGVHARAAQTGNGNILIAWANIANKSIDYLVLNSTYNTLLGLQSIQNLDARVMDNCSLIADLSGNFVITSADKEWEKALYYVVLDNSGAKLTLHALAFITDFTGNSFVQTGTTGQEIAPYGGGYFLTLPVVKK